MPGIKMHVQSLLNLMCPNSWIAQIIR